MWCDHPHNLIWKAPLPSLGGHLRQGSWELEAGLLKVSTDHSSGEERLGDIGHSWESFSPH